MSPERDEVPSRSGAVPSSQNDVVGGFPATSLVRGKGFDGERVSFAVGGGSLGSREGVRRRTDTFAVGGWVRGKGFDGEQIRSPSVVGFAGGIGRRATSFAVERCCGWISRHVVGVANVVRRRTTWQVGFLPRRSVSRRTDSERRRRTAPCRVVPPLLPALSHPSSCSPLPSSLRSPHPPFSTPWFAPWADDVATAPTSLDEGRGSPCRRRCRVVVIVVFVVVAVSSSSSSPS
ncbi:hypothetical protein M413DRAFT_30114 [Hebeloma cylindrosporum]|uniref:Uncharacterized protein n=1 Tax=Hebeloma cylindrosporum TaxID=76867 RepID=A0A0C2YC51_HEBCY|nr:hypothetical protein M413DRAFT_30114 [Hebeloma cylindrosporum h7]